MRIFLRIFVIVSCVWRNEKNAYVNANLVCNSNFIDKPPSIRIPFMFKFIFFFNSHCHKLFIIFFFFPPQVKPTSINITSKPKHFASEIEYSINCEVDGSIPETEIRWTQNNRPFKRGKVS